MKKNKTMRIASVLLIAVLLTTSVISGTFAKYVTTGEAGDSARVAKFGVAIEGSGSLFDVTYKKVSDGNIPGNTTSTTSDGQYDADNTASLTVESSNGNKLVAPGTKSSGNGFTLSITGTPEVDVRITFAIANGYKDVSLKAGKYPDLTTAKVGDTFTLTEDYYPIKYRLAGTIVKDNDQAIINAIANIGGTWNADHSVIFGNLDVINAALDAIGDVYVDANEDLSTVFTSDTMNLSWEWAFDGNDQADTLLGDLAAGTATWDDGKAINHANYSLNVDVALTVTVTQVD